MVVVGVMGVLEGARLILLIRGMGEDGEGGGMINRRWRLQWIIIWNIWSFRGLGCVRPMRWGCATTRNVVYRIFSQSTTA